MPITKLPVVHKFGIISSSQRLELQERLLKQTYLSSLKTNVNKASSTKRIQYEVTEEFVQMFNATIAYDDKEAFEEKARKLLERSKRRSGVKNCGYGEHVNLPLAWTEMAQLAQCKGRIQEECLNTLVTSLSVSPVEKYHIPALFFLAETMLYWLRTEAIHQPFLRTAEIKLLQMGQLVFQRLFYHHMAGQLQGHTESKNRLCTYIDGLQECQAAYNPYPNALLSLRFIIEVGKIILADSQLEPGDIKEGDRLPDAPKHNMEELTSSTKEMYERRNQDDTRSIHSGAISSSVHDLSPTLWHALDVWRCTNSLGGGLREALKALAHCGLGLASETWVDGIVAIQILSETAKSNMSAMKVLHRLAQGVKTTEDLMTPPLSSRSGQTDMFSISSGGNDILEEDAERKLDESRESFYSSKPSLSDIYERSEEGEVGDKKLRSIEGDSTGSESDKKDDSTDRSQTGESEVSIEKNENYQDDKAVFDQQEILKSSHSMDDKPKTAIRESGMLTKSSLMREVSFDEATLSRRTGTNEFARSSQDQRFLDSKLSQQTFDPDRGTGWRAEAGSEFKSGRASDTSSVQTFTNMPVPDTPGITGWHWEVAITYTDVLANVVLYGSTADIQKHALVGNNIDIDSIYHRGNHNVSIGTSQLSSAGLFDLAFFKPRNETLDGGPNDWSWRIRYGAIQSLVKICRGLEGDTNRDGLRTTAWNVLLRAHAMEKDSRVLEALKVGQVHTKDKNFLDPSHHESPATLGIRMAMGLSNIYLPPLPPPVTTKSSVRQGPRPRPVIRPKAPNKGSNRRPLRTTLKQEIELATALYEQAPDYNSRTSFDLRRVIEDQWRKELQANLENEEEAELKRIKEKQEEEEERQRGIAAARETKLSKKSGNSQEHIVHLGIPGKEAPLGSFAADVKQQLIQVGIPGREAPLGSF